MRLPMKKSIPLLCVAIGLAQLLGKAQEPLVRNCSAPERYTHLVALNEDFRSRMVVLKNESQKLFGLWASGQAAPQSFTIPVVVHVVYNRDVEKISIEQVKSQIAVLNRDFNQTFLDLVPERFKSLPDAANITFQLATRDPLGKATIGITFTETSVGAFTDSNDYVKSSIHGGVDPWPREDYLNIWVCNLKKSDTGEALFGYSSWPYEPAKADGVVILYRAFGTVGTVMPPYNKGRTATHEIGH
jgi:hypothetical protein